MTAVIPIFLLGVMQRPCLGRDLAPMSADDADAGNAAVLAARAKEAGAREGKDTPESAAASGPLEAKEGDHTLKEQPATDATAAATSEMSSQLRAASRAAAERLRASQLSRPEELHEELLPAP